MSTTATARRALHWQHLAMWAGIFLLFLLFVEAVKPILLPFVLGIAVAYLVDPLAHRLGRMGMGRSTAAAVLTIGLFTTLITAAVWLGPLLYHQLVGLVTKLPELIKQFTLAAQQDAAPLFTTLHTLAGSNGESIPNSMGEVVQKSFAAVSGVVSRVVTSAMSAINVMALLLITPIVCFYLIRDWPGVLSRTHALLPRAYAPTILEQLGLINKTLAAYLRGQLMVMLVLVAYYSVAFVIIGVDYSLLLALAAGFLVIIPYIGTLISVVLGLIVAYGQFGMDGHWWAMAAVYGVGQMAEGQFLTPQIIGDRVGLHPLWMLFGMLSGAVLFGFVGVLLAVPLTAVISVLVKFAIGRYLESGLYSQP